METEWRCFPPGPSHQASPCYPARTPWLPSRRHELLREPRGSCHLDTARQTALARGAHLTPVRQGRRAPAMLGNPCPHLLLTASRRTPAVYRAPGVAAGARGHGGEEKGPRPAPGTHSPSSSCLRASFAGSRLRGRRWHLASRTLKRAFSLMRMLGVPGESQSPRGGLSVGRAGAALCCLLSLPARPEQGASMDGEVKLRPGAN